MQQPDSKQHSTERRPASDLLRSSGALLLVMALLAGGAAYQFGFSDGILPAICCGVSAGGVLTWSLVVAKRERARSRFAAYLATELGSDWDPEGVRVRKYKDGTPRDIDLRYQARQPDHDPEWRRTLSEAVRRRMGVDEIKATWKVNKNRVRMIGLVTTVTELDKARKRTTERIKLVFQPLFRGVELHVKVPAWQDKSTQPARIELFYGVTSVDGSDLWVRRVEAMAGLKLGGRWRAAFDPTLDAGFLEPRPELPTNVPHLGVRLYDGSDPAFPKPNPKSPILYYGVDENSKPQGWLLGKKSTMPHGLFIGPTGGGKTTVLRSLILGAVAQGVPVFAADPKMIELTPFYGFPGCFVASTPDEIAKMVEKMEALMYERYETIKRNPRAADTLTPVLFILDELLIARQVLKRLHASRKGRGTPPWFACSH